MQQGGSQYGVSPEMTSFAGATSRTHMLEIQQQQNQLLQQQQQQKQGDVALAEAASPISSRPPARNFDELGQVSGGFPDEDALVAGEETERGAGGNRWPRQETLALLKIRSEMDAAFRDATLKGPLWEDVSRKLAELGYIRSAKKCKEKFENVHKYYKRTKEGRAGRQDGKSYRYFSQLEALHSSSSNTTPAITTGPTSTPPLPSPAPISVGIPSNTMVGSSGRVQHVTPVSSAAPVHINVPRSVPDLRTGPSTGISAPTAGISFSSNTSSSSSESDEETEPGPDARKRKRSGSGSGGSRKMMVFFEGLMKQVMEKQEQMQQRFLETIEKREQDRMIREEAWKRQEMARLTREHEILAQERAMSASRDAAVIAFLQKITGQTIQLPPPVTIPAAPPPQSTPPPPPPQPQQQQQQPQPQQQHQQHHQPQLQLQQHQQPQSTEIVRHQPPQSSEIVVQEPQQQQQHQEIAPSGNFDPASSRWPKAEVHALIKLRSGLESRYQEAGPKGPLWEEISAGMQRMGYNRSAKRCKEKWENINKYFKKVKESHKKRPEDAKTCPYFHQLDALYRKKILGSGGGGGGNSSTSLGNQNNQGQNPDQNPNQNTNQQERTDVLAIMPPPAQQETEPKNNNNNKNGGNPQGGGSNIQVQTSNGGLPPSFFEGAVKKPEDIVKELMEQQQQQQAVMDDYDKLEEPDSDNLDQDDDEDEDDEEDDDDDEEDRKMAYKIQFQRQTANPSNGGGSTNAGSFLAVVQ